MERQIMNFRSGFGGASVWTIQFRAVVTALIGFYCLPADIGGQVVDNTPAFGTHRGWFTSSTSKSAGLMPTPADPVDSG